MSMNVTAVTLNDSQGVRGTGSLEFGGMRTLDIVVIATVLVLIFVISLTGNIFVFLVFYKKPTLLTISNRFIVNLSVCNVLETLFVMPFVFMVIVTQTWYFGGFLCQATGFLMNAIFAASTLTLVVIAIDRYCAIVTPLHYSMRITPRRATAMIVMVWLLAVCCSMPPLIGWNRYEFQRDKSVCTAVATSKTLNDRSFTIFLVVLCFILPLIVILWAYCIIFQAARNSSEKVRRNSTLTNLDEIIQTPLRHGRRSSTAPILAHRLSISSRGNGQIWKRDEWKAAVTSCLVVFTFIICWLLYFIIIVLECLGEDPDNIQSVIKTLSILLAMSSCAFNPVVYVFRGKAQRAELRAILGMKRKHFNLTNGPHGFPIHSSLISRSPCVSRQGSEESDIIQKLHHVTTATTLTSMVVTEEPDVRYSTRT